MPAEAAGHALHFELTLDTDAGLDDPVISTRSTLDGFEWYDGLVWSAFPPRGLAPGTGRLVRYTPISTLGLGDDWHWTVRAWDTVSGDYGASATARRFLLANAAWTLGLAGGAEIRAIHLTELRTEANRARLFRGLDVASWTDTITPRVTPIRAIHFTELRQALQEVAATSGSTVTIGAEPIQPGSDIRATHLLELRTALGGL